MDNLTNQLAVCGFFETKTTDDCLKILSDTLSAKDRLIESLRNQIKELKQENYKDIAIKNMQLEIDGLRSQLHNGFGITAEEQEKINHWIAEHTKHKHKGNKYCGAIGGRYSYEFTPTGIGTFGTIKCSCGESFDFCDGKDF